MAESVVERLNRNVIAAGICTGCGACVALAPTGGAALIETAEGPLPRFAPSAALPDLAWDVCPGRGVPYAALYRAHYGCVPDNWLAGCFEAVRTGYAADPVIRRNGASGGVTTQVLTHLLDTGRIDAAIVVRQGVPEPERASPVVARTAAEIQAAAQSVYIPVAVLSILAQLQPGLRYAMTCLPDQAAVLRRLQQAGHPAARQIRYVLGPYTGTALAPGAIACYLRSKGVRPGTDPVASLKWRAGEWPGYMEIVLASGKVFRTPKVYYNFLIPFFVTQASLQGMDFANEFCDLSVGDAWSPRFEALGGGHSVIVTRTKEMESIIREMESQGLLVTEAADPLRTLEMHGHMLDFKKRGSYIRNQVRRRLGLRAPDHGLRPVPLPASRVAVELVIMLLFAVGRTRVARWCVAHIPERVIGPLFNRLRLGWKALSKPTKRKGLGTLAMQEVAREG
ncbi:MAG: Coenzyme F420 hydrogenase/dehydrogenase, beta subunit C-terminal domain [Lentisphaerae bacterium]|nr:Coenzyme F420 hydrogenase/dehydrogenase, beta subunit C-terminal domain [Lentisphaerota bacterium]